MRLETILVIEDDAVHAILTNRIIRKIVPSVAIAVQTTGEDALEYLQSVAHPPQLILLDIGLPRMDGFEFILQMRTIKRLNPVPIVILTGRPLDIAKAHEMNVAAGYIVKPMDAPHFREQLINLGFETNADTDT